jgi:hypothetical protein
MFTELLLNLGEALHFSRQISENVDLQSFAIAVRPHTAVQIAKVHGSFAECLAK